MQHGLSGNINGRGQPEQQGIFPWCRPLHPEPFAVDGKTVRGARTEEQDTSKQLCVMSAAYNLVARCIDAYHIPSCKTLLSLTTTAAFPLFQVIIDYEQPGASRGARYRMPTLL